MLRVLNQFGHGYVFAPMAAALRAGGLFQVLDSDRPRLLDDMVRELGANAGPVRVGLDMLRVMDWVRLGPSGWILGPEAQGLAAVPDDVLDLYAHAPADLVTSPALACVLSDQLDRVVRGWGCPAPLSLFLDGMVLLPLLVGAAQTGTIGALSSGDDGALPALDAVRRFLEARKWGATGDDGFALGGAGKFMFGRALVGGVTVSYRPMLRRLPDLFFGDADAVFAADGSGECHVDRSLNVLASGFSHGKYFAELDGLVLRACGPEVPPERRPSHVADMGCGDGSLLKRIHGLLGDAPNPPVMVGLDLNRAALEAASGTLADVPHLLLTADVGNPHGLMQALVGRMGHAPGAILHVRSFLDHNRVYAPPRDTTAARDRERLGLGGVGVGPGGSLIPAGFLQQGLVEHLRAWADILGPDGGLLCLEVHAMSHWAKAASLEMAEGLHFDALHALSRQYLCEPLAFVAAMAEAGLFPEGGLRAQPRGFSYARITVGHYRRRPYSVRFAAEGDVVALAEAVWEQDTLVPADVALRLVREHSTSCFTALDEAGNPRAMLLCESGPLDEESLTRPVALRGLAALEPGWTGVLLRHCRTCFELQDGEPSFAGPLAVPAPEPDVNEE